MLLAVGTYFVPAAGAAPGPAQKPVAKDPGSISIRLLDASVERRDDPRSRLYVNDHLDAGSTITRHVEVASTARRAVRLSFYPAAAEVDRGEFVVGAGRARNELTQWTTVTPAAATLSPGERQVLTVRIAVPEDAESGERYAAVLAELPAPTTAAGSLGVGARVGVRLYLSVGDGSEPRTDFEVSSLTAARTDDGRPQVLAQVRNTGGRALDLTGTLTLREGPGGLRAGPYPVELGTTLGVGQTASVSVLLDEQLPAGPWRAVLELTSGTVTRGVQGTVTFPAAAGAVGSAVPVEPLHQRKQVVAPAAGALLTLLGLFLLFLLWRRRRDKEDEDTPVDDHADRPLVAGAAAR